LTARRRLRADRLSRLRSRAARGERSSFFGCLTLRRSRLLTPFPIESGTRERSFFIRRSRCHGLHVNAVRFREIEAPSAEKVQIERPREHPPGALLPLAGGCSCCTCSSMFENVD
jgi:hypothetical protein